MENETEEEMLIRQTLESRQLNELHSMQRQALYSKTSNFSPKNSKLDSCNDRIELKWTICTKK